MRRRSIAPTRRSAPSANRDAAYATGGARFLVKTSITAMLGTPTPAGLATRRTRVNSCTQVCTAAKKN